MADRGVTGVELRGDNLATPVKDGLKEVIERELIRATPMEMAAKFSQVTHSQDAAMALQDELPVSEDMERKIQDFARKLTRVKDQAKIPALSN